MKDEEDAVSIETKEETPPAPSMTPIPYKKVFIGAMIWFIDWFNGSCLATFVGFMVLDFGMASTKAEVGYYSGFISSTYYFSQFLSSFWWGKISDKYGRRPILLIGLMGSLISTLAFGFSKNFAFAIVARSLNGLLNSNSGIVKTYVAEITDSTNQARAFGYLSLFGGLGMVVGPMVGGYFSKPAEKHPNLFPEGSLFYNYPYLLPSLISAALNVILLILAFIYLSETLKSKYTRLQQQESEPALPKSSVEMKDVSSADLQEKEEEKDGANLANENEGLINEKEKDGEIAAEREEMPNPVRRWISERIAKLGVLKDRNVILSCGLYAFYGFTSSVYGEVLPLFALLPIALGGMGLGTDGIGNLATMAGASIILFNLLFYHRIVRRFGLIMTYQLGTTGLIFLHVICAEIPRWTLNADTTPGEDIYGSSRWAFWAFALVFSWMFWCGRQMQLTSCMQLISNSVTPKDMGSVNGLAQSLVALTRMCAPTFGSTVLAWSVSVNKYFFLTSRFVFIILGILSLVMALTTKQLDKSLNKPKSEQK